jgi:NCAIR mutase (PurE)-related protein
MDEKRLRKLLDDLRKGRISEDQAFEALKRLPFGELGIAKVDHHRFIRRGLPEVILGEGKTIQQVNAIAGEMLKQEMNVLVTRASREITRGVRKKFPEARINSQARTITIVKKPIRKAGKGLVLIITAGTSDLPVAEEARESAEFLGNRVEVLYDVGVAGIHRLLDHEEKLRKARVLIVVAGMEGALASVVSGLVDKPVIAVPTSTGYGASFGGVSALLGMLNSCASGVSVVNIDNGFGAACAATMINRL